MLVRDKGEGTWNVLVRSCQIGISYVMDKGTQVKQTNKNTCKNRDPRGLSQWTHQNCSGDFSLGTCKITYLRSKGSKGRVHGAREILNLDLQANNNKYFYIF